MCKIVYPYIVYPFLTGIGFGCSVQQSRARGECVARAAQTNASPTVM